MGVSPRFLSGTAMGEVGLLFGVLYATEFYKQRFYLGGRPEWGIHWRSMVLGMVKWPSLALALLDVLLDRKPAYNTTRKVAATSRDRLVFRHHAPVVVVIAFGRSVHPTLHFWSVFLVVASLAFIWTDTWDFPPPYEDERWDPGPGFGSREV